MGATVLAPGTLSLLRMENGRTLIHTIVTAAPETADRYGWRWSEVSTLSATYGNGQFTLSTYWSADRMHNRELVQP